MKTSSQPGLSGPAFRKPYLFYAVEDQVRDLLSLLRSLPDRSKVCFSRKHQDRFQSSADAGCDIGIEVATERKEAENDLFCVRGIDVHDNVVADCGGSGGISFGGYDSSRGSTEECRFHDNTLVDNELQFAVQKSRYNKVYDNLIVGGKAAFSFEPGGPESTVTNDIRANAAADLGDDGSWKASYGKYHESRQQVLDGLRPRIKGCGSSFVPEGEALEVYRDN